MCASFSLLVADVKTRKWSFLLEEHNKLSEKATSLLLSMMLTFSNSLSFKRALKRGFSSLLP